MHSTILLHYFPGKCPGIHPLTILNDDLQVSCVEFLLGLKGGGVALCGTQDSDGATPLHYAALGKNTPILAAILRQLVSQSLDPQVIKARTCSNILVERSSLLCVCYSEMASPLKAHFLIRGVFVCVFILISFEVYRIYEQTESVGFIIIMCVFVCFGSLAKQTEPVRCWFLTLY